MLSDAFSDLTGEPVLRDLVERVGAIDPGDVVQAGDHVRAVGEGLDGSVRAVAGSVAGGRWRGSGADAALAWLGRFGAAGARTRDLTGRVADELVGAGGAVQDARSEVGRHVSDALTAARAARARALAGGADVVRAATDATAGPIAAAEASVARAEHAVADAARRIVALAEEMTAFSALPVPDDAVAAGAGAVGPVGAVRSMRRSMRGSVPGRSSADDGSVRRPSARTESDGLGSTSSASRVAAHRIGAPHGSTVTEHHAHEPAGRTAPVLTGPVGAWIHRAVDILAAQGVPVDRMNPADIATIIDRESGGDPDAVNGADANAARGTPSQGLMQTIGPTFRAYALPGHGDIHDPVDNIIAGVRYAIARYGSVSRVPGVVALARGHAYVGY